MAFLAGSFVACNSNEPKPAGQETKPSGDTAVIAQQTDTPDFRDSIQYDSIRFPEPYDTSFPGHIITTGGFHGDEVWDNLEQENWFGLFKGAQRYYIAATPVTVKAVYDAIVDEDSTKDITGREVLVPNNDTCVLLMSHLEDFLKAHEVEPALLPRDRVKPGESITIRYRDVEYTLSATGNSRMAGENDEYIWNYKLYLTAAKNGTTVKQMLAAFPSFDDQMVTLLFAGDIDGDGKLDFIIDTTNHYNVTVPTL